MVSTIIGWNVHGHWVGPRELEPVDGRPRKARCSGPRTCAGCSDIVKTPAPRADGVRLELCSYCGELIIWAETMPNPRARTKLDETKKIPFDAEPDDHGRWALTPRAGKPPTCGEMAPGMAAGYRAAGKPTYQKHVKSCTQLSKWPKGQYLAKPTRGRA